MLDSETLRPAIISATIYLVMVHIIPSMIKTPPQNKLLSDFYNYIKNQKTTLQSGIIMVSLITILTNYMQHEYF